MWTDLDKNRIVASSHIWGNARINILWIPETFMNYIGNLENQVCFMIFGFHADYVSCLGTLCILLTR